MYEKSALFEDQGRSRGGGATGACAPPFSKKESTFSKKNTT